MSFLKIFGVVVLFFVILAGLLISLFALTSQQPLDFSTASFFSVPFYQDPAQTTVLIVLFLLVVLFAAFIIHERSHHETLEALEEEKIEEPKEDQEEADQERLPQLSASYPTPEVEVQEPEITERVFLPQEKELSESEFKKFLKDTIIELEREKARLYHEVYLLDQDYQKGLITQNEFLTGINLLLGEKSLEEVIEEKERQIKHCKQKLKVTA